MSRKVIVAESGCDMPKNLVNEYDIKIVPMHVAMDGKNLNDGEFPVTEVFSYYNSTKKLPTTSATSPDEYKTMFESIHENDPDAQIIHLCYSAVTTATYQNSLIGSEDMDYVTHIDTKGVTGGQSAVILKMAEFLRKNPDASIEHIKKEADFWITRSRCAFFPGDLDYLRAGGRVSNAAYIGATILGLKPLIEILDGKLVGTKKYRGSRDKVCKKFLMEYLKENALEKESIYFLFSQGLDPQLMKELENIAAEMGYPSVLWVETGCTISTHCGPGAFGVGGFVL